MDWKITHLPFTNFPHRQQDALDMTTQKALWLPNVGAEFTLGKHAIPEPGPGEVLVQLEAAALNPVDWKLQKSGFKLVNEYPAIVGEDGAGVVRKVGEGVTDLSEGDKMSVLSSYRVVVGSHRLYTVRFFQTSFGNNHATFQQYCLTNAALAIKVICCRIDVHLSCLTQWFIDATQRHV